MKKKKNLKLKKNLPLIEPIYIGDYKWPSAYEALKGLCVYSFFWSKQRSGGSAYVVPEFIKDVLKGMYDDDIKPLSAIKKKEELRQIKDISFLDILRLPFN